MVNDNIFHLKDGCMEKERVKVQTEHHLTNPSILWPCDKKKNVKKGPELKMLKSL